MASSCFATCRGDQDHLASSHHAAPSFVETPQNPQRALGRMNRRSQGSGCSTSHAVLASSRTRFVPLAVTSSAAAVPAFAQLDAPATKKFGSAHDGTSSRRQISYGYGVRRAST